MAHLSPGPICRRQDAVARDFAHQRQATSNGQYGKSIAGLAAAPNRKRHSLWGDIVPIGYRPPIIWRIVTTLS